MKLSGTVAIVTGSGRGIGRAIALKLASEGAKVVVNDLDTEPAEETLAMIRARGGEGALCLGNVTAADFGTRIVDTAVTQFGRLDILVNNAGFTWDNVIQKMSDEQWYAVLDCHLTAPFRIMRAAIEYFKTAAKAEAALGQAVYRKVVNISSTSGTNGNPGQANYSAAKAGIIGLTKTMAREWGRYKVNVNAIAFGLIRTRLTDAVADGSATVEIEGRKLRVGISQESFDLAEKFIPLGRAGTPEEAAGAVYLFCLPESNYISGQVVVCAGGF